MKNKIKLAMEVSIRRQIATSFLLAMTYLVGGSITETTIKPARHRERMCGDLSTMKNNIQLAMEVRNSKQIATSFLLAMTYLVGGSITETTLKPARHRERMCGDLSAMKNIFKVARGVRISRQIATSFLLAMTSPM